MRERAQQDGFGLPELMEGWTWASLVGVEEDEWLEFPELDDLVASAALDAAAASLGFAVMDSDSVYLVGADPSGVRFHLVVNEEAAARIASLDEVADISPDAYRRLESERSYAPIRGFRDHKDETRWLLVAEGEFQPETASSLFRSGEQVRMLDPSFEGRVDLEQELRGPGFNLDLGDWEPVPDEVERDLASTAAWIISARDTSGA